MARCLDFTCAEYLSRPSCPDGCGIYKYAQQQEGRITIFDRRILRTAGNAIGLFPRLGSEPQVVKRNDIQFYSYQDLVAIEPLVNENLPSSYPTERPFLIHQDKLFMAVDPRIQNINTYMQVLWTMCGNASPTIGWLDLRKWLDSFNKASEERLFYFHFPTLVGLDKAAELSWRENLNKALEALNQRRIVTPPESYPTCPNPKKGEYTPKGVNRPQEPGYIRQFRL